MSGPSFDGRDAHAPIGELWEAHARAIAEASASPTAAARRSLLELKAAVARRLLRACVLCERRCGVDRISGARGHCGCDIEARLYFAGLLVAEEPEISPSFCVFPSGCNFHCSFCCVGEENAHPERGEPLRAQAIDARLRLPENAAARTLSLIGGEPTVHLYAILRALARTRSHLPVVWNSNFYFSTETALLLDGVIDVFVADCHFGSDHCARELAGLGNHFAVVTRNLLWSAQRSRLILRHLALPGHMACCTRPVLEWAAAHLAVPVHVMCNYVPPRTMQRGQLARSLTSAEMEAAISCASDLGLKLVSSASLALVSPKS